MPLELGNYSGLDNPQPSAFPMAPPGSLDEDRTVSSGFDIALDDSGSTGRNCQKTNSVDPAQPQYPNELTTPPIAPPIQGGPRRPWGARPEVIDDILWGPDSPGDSDDGLSAFIVSEVSSPNQKTFASWSRGDTKASGRMHRNSLV